MDIKFNLIVTGITLGFVVFDILTGLIAAFKNGEFKSSIMREGLYHKIGTLLIVIFLNYVDGVQKFVNIGVSVPVATFGCSYICLMEIGSICENVNKINPELTPEFIKKILKGANEK